MNLSDKHYKNQPYILKKQIKPTLTILQTRANSFVKTINLTDFCHVLR